MIKVLNSLSGKKEILKPHYDKKIKMFVCGPTVFDMTHLGHARTALSFDMIVKYLRLKGYDVFFLQNITDIDDKIIKRANEEGVLWKQIARKYEKVYLQSMKSLGITAISQYARATDYIPEIINQVQRLLDKGYAYFLDDGIYYDLSKFKDYGKLSKRTTLQAEDGVSRIDEAVGKRNRGDFCLWKKSKAGEPKWKSPWFFGRPGWHIEDTAITEKFFGPQYDIHGGGRDLMFPHHEAEIAQMEALSGKKPFVKYWLHTGFLTINGEKMSKSLKNFITVDEFLQKYEEGARILRLLVLKNHYRLAIDFNEKIIEQIKKELKIFDEFEQRLKLVKKEQKGILKMQLIKKEFYLAMDDDFNTPKAMGIIFSLIRRANLLIDKNQLSKKEAGEILEFLKEIDNFFGFIFRKNKKKEMIPAEVLKLVEKREKYRQEKNFFQADIMRNEIKKLGYLVEDTFNGPVIKKLEK
ncbi:MAG TPA: cysteine--tRNA ligase [Candidatus Paceibacterota bacterium]|nr:cysteine--tRNA ligase [Parcubacteria group bacterium]HOM33267.1 cysteine--tRNA ligase [Candidatus Paceibacterota bacterium]HPC37263.1 cysteine--tRNA ligase [Candidatus Paceibacterota bacterium]HRU35720.1 cysteine--tRNA ligase [Candidatus Paceibacterota bacterium]